MPSGASRGEPFTTVDGYTITVERLVIIALVTSNDATAFDTFGRVVRGTRGAAVFQRALPLGESEVRLGLQGLYIGVYGQNAARQVEDWDQLGPDEQARMSRAADSTVPSGSGGAVGPAALLDVRATRGSATFVMRVSLASTALYADHSRTATLRVARDALALTPAQLRAEAFFGDHFETFAAADSDGDGVVTREELLKAPIAPTDGGDLTLPGARPVTAMELLAARLQNRVLAL